MWCTETFSKKFIIFFMLFYQYIKAGNVNQHNVVLFQSDLYFILF